MSARSGESRTRFYRAGIYFSFDVDTNVGLDIAILTLKNCNFDLKITAFTLKSLHLPLSHYIDLDIGVMTLKSLY